MRARLPSSILCLLALGSGTQAQQFEYGDQRQFLTEAGFPVIDGHTTNPCGMVARPMVVPLDLNNDGLKLEALLVDKGPCYKVDGTYFALLAHTGVNMPWRLLFRHEGTLSPEPTFTGAWRNVSFVSGGRKVMLHSAGFIYVTPEGRGPTIDSPVSAAHNWGGAPERSGAASRPAAALPAPGAAAGGGWADAGWRLPAKVATLPAAAAAGALKAGGAHKVGTKWYGAAGTCAPAQIDEPVVDLNGDGHADIVIFFNDDRCGGIPGGEYSLLTATTGGWKEISHGLGDPAFDPKHRGVGGWPDLIETGPRICNAVSRWNGHEYVGHGFTDGEKPCTPG